MRHAFDNRDNASFRNTLSIRGGDESHSDPAKAAKALAKPLSPVADETKRARGSDPDLDSGDETEKEWPEIDLASLMPGARFFGADNLTVTRLVDSPDCVLPGDVVTYRIGEDDPNLLIAEALARGASGILTEQLLPSPLPQCVVGSVDLASAKIASARHGCPDRKLLTVGVLGASGKTSTCLLAATLTKGLGIRTAYQCDLGASDGVISDAPRTKVAVGADLVNWLGESSDCLSRAAFIELDERAARDGRYDAIQFDVLIVTGKTDPADDYGPCGLQCVMERLTPAGIVIAPGEVAKTVEFIDNAGCQLVTYGTTAECEFGAMMLDQSGGMSTLMLSAGDTSVIMETSLCGLAMANNIAAAVALGTLLGHGVEEISRHLATLRSIPGRGQRMVEFGRATVMVESCGSLDRATQSLRTAKATGLGGRVWCVLAINDQDDAETLAGYGNAIEKLAHHCVVTSQPEQSASFLKHSHQVLDGVKECAAMRLVADRSRAIEWAIQQAGPRDTVVVLTNQQAEHAAAGRGDVQSIENLIEATRRKMDPVLEEDAKSETSQPITLKLFR